MKGRQKLSTALAFSALFALVVAACGGEAEPPAAAARPAEPSALADAPATDATDQPESRPAASAPPGSADATALDTTGAPVGETPPVELSPPASAEKAMSVEAEAAVVGAEKVPLEATGRKGDEELAPELKGISGWINSEPFTLESHRGKVVLVDFWTYTCINCIRTLPYLKAWHEKYADEGLVIVGVHTPEFDFEKIRQNVVEAMDEFELKYAVAQDNDYKTWDAFENRAWPSKYLIDKDGYIRYNHVGEGAYDETEQKIRELLSEAGSDLSSISDLTAPAPDFDPNAEAAERGKELTRELYAGASRNYNLLYSSSMPPYVLHAKYYESLNADVEYQAPETYQNHFIYLAGLWRNKEESLVHARETEDYEDYIGIMFYATSVNAVLAPDNANPFTVRLTLDDAPLEVEKAGEDVMYDEDGNSYIYVDESRLYRLVDMPVFSGHKLKLSSTSPEMSLFAFTFGAYMEGEPKP